MSLRITVRLKKINAKCFPHLAYAVDVKQIFSPHEAKKDLRIVMTKLYKVSKVHMQAKSCINYTNQICKVYKFFFFLISEKFKKFKFI